MHCSNTSIKLELGTHCNSFNINEHGTLNLSMQQTQGFPVTVSQVELGIEHHHRRSKTEPFEGVKIL